jgi:hypothetical protein
MSIRNFQSNYYNPHPQQHYLSINKKLREGPLHVLLHLPFFV